MAQEQQEIRYLTPKVAETRKKKILPFQKERYQVYRL